VVAWQRGLASSMDLLRRRGSSGLGHERRYRDVRGASGLPGKIAAAQRTDVQGHGTKVAALQPAAREALVTSREDCDGAPGTCPENQQAIDSCFGFTVGTLSAAVPAAFQRAATHKVSAKTPQCRGVDAPHAERGMVNAWSPCGPSMPPVHSRDSPTVHISCQQIFPSKRRWSPSLP
jgi:hypothetical protein